MKDTSEGLRAEYAAELTTLASIWRVVREDGVELGFTDFDEDVEYDGVTYQAATGFSRSALETQSGLSVDNMDVQGLLSSESITREDIEAGRYRGAKVWYAELDPTQPELGLNKHTFGVIGRVNVHSDHFEAEVRDLTALLDQETGEKYTRYCPHKLGSSEILFGVETKCGIVLEPPVWEAGKYVAPMTARRATTYDGRRYVCSGGGTTGVTEPAWNPSIGGATIDGSVEWTTYEAYTFESTTTAADDNRQLIITDDLLRPTHDLRGGELTFTTGRNAGVPLQVKTNLPGLRLATVAGTPLSFVNGEDWGIGSGRILLMFPAPYQILPGDEFKVTVGCNHLLRSPDDEWESQGGGASYTGDCRIKFRPEAGGNAENFGGECEIPGTDGALNVR